MMKEKSGLSIGWILKQLDIGRSTYYRWINFKPKEKKNFVNPLKSLKWEAEAVISYALEHKGMGYKKLTFKMLDENIVALTPSQVYRILKNANMLLKWGRIKNGAGKEYKEKPTKPNEHWHTDIIYIKVSGLWCFLMVVLDGFSRYVVGWKVMLDMTAQSVSMFIQQCQNEVRRVFGEGKIDKRQRTTIDKEGVQTGFNEWENTADKDKKEPSGNEWEDRKVQRAFKTGEPETPQSCDNTGSEKSCWKVYRLL